LQIFILNRDFFGGYPSIVKLTKHRNVQTPKTHYSLFVQFLNVEI